MLEEKSHYLIPKSAESHLRSRPGSPGGIQTRRLGQVHCHTAAARNDFYGSGFIGCRFMILSQRKRIGTGTVDGRKEEGRDFDLVTRDTCNQVAPRHLLELFFSYEWAQATISYSCHIKTRGPSRNSAMFRSTVELGRPTVNVVCKTLFHAKSGCLISRRRTYGHGRSSHKTSTF